MLQNSNMTDTVSATMRRWTTKITFSGELIFVSIMRIAFQKYFGSMQYPDPIENQYKYAVCST